MMLNDDIQKAAEQNWRPRRDALLYGAQTEPRRQPPPGFHGWSGRERFFLLACGEFPARRHVIRRNAPRTCAKPESGTGGTHGTVLLQKSHSVRTCVRPISSLAQHGGHFST